MQTYCSPRELEVLNWWISIMVTGQLPPILNDVSEVTSAITEKQFRAFKMVTVISQHFSSSPNFTMQSSCVEEDIMDISQVMDFQSQQQRTNLNQFLNFFMKKYQKHCHPSSKKRRKRAKEN